MSYAIVEGFCVVYALVVLFALNDSISSEREVLDLRRILAAYLAFLVSDIICATVSGKTSQPWLALNVFASGISLVAVSFGCYFWYRFVEDRLHPFRSLSRTYRLISLVPITLSCALEVASIFTGWVFYVDPAGFYQTTDLFNYVPGIFNYLYLSVPTLVAIIYARREAMAGEHAEYLAYSTSMVIALLVGFTEDFFPSVPVLALCVFMVIHVVFVTLQDQQAWRDGLTGLSNRRSLEEQLPEILRGASETRPIGLFAIDVSNLAAVNDSCGYLTGDAVLKAFSKRLRTVSAGFDAFVARSGGSMFCLVVDLSRCSRREVEELVLGSSRDASEEEGIDACCPVVLSIGFSECRDPSTDADELIDATVSKVRHEGGIQAKRRQPLPAGGR